MLMHSRIVSGRSVLRKFLQSERSSLIQASPILLISSSLPDQQPTVAVTAIPAVDEACRKLQFYTSMEMGLRTVPSTVTSAFATVSQVKETCDLMQRTGARTIMAVGSGAAVDLAKAVIQREQVHKEITGIIMPSTYGATIASTSALSLLLDTTEEALVVPETANHDTVQGVTIIVETDALSDVHKRDAVWACCAIGVDAVYRGQEDAANLLHVANSALTEDSMTPQALLDAGMALNFGLEGSSVRSSPLALAASLIPTSFPNAPLVTFMASLLPGIVQVMGEGGQGDETIGKISQDSASTPSLASLMVHADGAQPVSTLMSHVKANRALWKCFDVPDNVLEAILHHSLNR